MPSKAWTGSASIVNVDLRNIDEVRDGVIAGGAGVVQIPCKEVHAVLMCLGRDALDDTKLAILGAAGILREGVL
jgi:predicted amino acid dehydrogenase